MALWPTQYYIPVNWYLGLTPQVAHPILWSYHLHNNRPTIWTISSVTLIIVIKVTHLRNWTHSFTSTVNTVSNRYLKNYHMRNKGPYFYQFCSDPEIKQGHSLLNLSEPFMKSTCGMNMIPLFPFYRIHVGLYKTYEQTDDKKMGSLRPFSFTSSWAEENNKIYRVHMFSIADVQGWRCCSQKILPESKVISAGWNRRKDAAVHSAQICGPNE